MKILITANTAWNLTNFRAPIIRRLLESGHEVVAVAPDDPKSLLLREWGCSFVNLDMDGGGMSPRNDYALFRRFKKIFEDEQPHIILSYTIKNNVFGALAAVKCDIPFVPNVSGLGTAFLSGKLLQKIASLLYKKAFRPLQVVFFQNEEDRDLFLDLELVRSNQARVLPGSGIDLDAFAATPQPQSKDAITFLLIARMLRDKGVMEYLEAAKMTLLKFPRAKFQLLGEIGADNRSAISAEDLAPWFDMDGIDYLGTSQDVRPLIAQADSIVLPSYREGAPRTLIEAASMARPVITTDVPGCRSVVDDEVTGLLCEAQNAEDLAAKMTMMIEAGKQRRAEMGVSGRLKMEREYDQKIVVDAYLEAIAAATQ